MDYMQKPCLKYKGYYHDPDSNPHRKVPAGDIHSDIGGGILHGAQSDLVYSREHPDVRRP
jgi:hypothetical protein